MRAPKDDKMVTLTSYKKAVFPEGGYVGTTRNSVQLLSLYPIERKMSSHLSLFMYPESQLYTPYVGIIFFRSVGGGRTAHHEIFICQAN